ncbi:hypothetical protein CW751_06895 [Brumimicrobium salinarum]|uniref:Uncharacterized protein n=1 Tax=Brumimicrobium salinarum TaxID=2058658 RepID=A0A2I0R2T6_9FLAO|nr:hypothetical protein [Brumimicrobium salinarum]PKR80891.1 hypothetical protein CW751_06895 [Brumimicrobium salinarum]
MDYITYIIVALIPALSIAFVVYTFIKKNNEKELSQVGAQLKQERQKFFLAPRADAYQRIVLLLERINPQSLIMRLHDPKKKALALQTELLAQIRQEFDHNVAQQIFVSHSAWNIVAKSKEETIKIINTAAQQLNAEATSTELSSKIFEIISELDELPTEIAIKVVKDEFQKLF